MSEKKINLLDLDRKGLRALFSEMGEKPFRADQLMKWLYHFGVSDFEQMTNINKALRAKLAARCEIVAPEISSYQKSTDGTIKFAINVGQGQEVETVYIPEEDRATLCVSSQVGCALECTFCSTAQQGFNRNLTVSEIVGQIWRVSHFLGFQKETGDRPITNVVMMGMGEPLANYNNVITAMNLMRDDYGYGISWRRLTLSTSGMVPMIDKLREDCHVSLAISLHAANDELRSQIIPLNQKYPISELLAACKRYVTGQQRRHITVEYVMLDGVNDSMQDAKDLVRILKDLPTKINLIPFNPFPGTDYKCSSRNQIMRFQKYLMDQGLVATVRKTRGDDIVAACGQLAGEVQDKTRRTQRLAQQEVVFHR